MNDLFSIGTYAVRADDLWIVATAMCAAVSCGILGCFLVLRGLSLLGDAISHAVLPGLALAFIATQSRSTAAMLGGALIAGVLTAGLSTLLHRRARVPQDAALGVVFSTFFALGVLLITWVASSIDLDPGCVLYGLIEFVPFDVVALFGFEMPRAFVWLFAALLVDILLVAIFFKELRITSFDPALATAMGLSAALVHYGLVTAVAATTVVSFEAVGSILVVAALIIPGATAHLLTDRLSRMVWIAAAIGAAMAIGGYVGAVMLNTSVAGMMSVVGGGLFSGAVLLAPQHGLVVRFARSVQLTARIAREDALGALYRLSEEAPERMAALAEIRFAAGGGWRGLFALRGLERSSAIAREGAAARLTSKGLAEARLVVRAHRLWESYLTARVGLPTDHVHDPSHRMEHYLDAEMQGRLVREVGAKTDPHGKPIPVDPAG